jgi:hypothetical protein
MLSSSSDSSSCWKKREIVGCTLDIRSHDVSELYENRLLCEIYWCTVVKTIIFESILWSGLPNNSKFSEGRMFSSWNSFRFHHDIVPKYYYYGPRLTQILHARLRMRSSSLNEHLYITFTLRNILMNCPKNNNIWIDIKVRTAK